MLLRGPDARAGRGSARLACGDGADSLEQGCERLRSRLLSRGLAPTAGLLAATGGGEAVAGSIPPALAVATVRAALLHAAGESIAGVVPASAVAMAERGLKMMSLTRWKAIAFTLMTIGGGTAGVVAFAQSRQHAGQGEVRPSGVAAVARPRDDRAWNAAAAERVETARSAVDELMDPLLTNTFPADDWASKFRLLDAIPTWSRRLMEDRIRVAGDRAARLAALREHRDRMKKLEMLYTELQEAWKLWSFDVKNVKYHRLEADQLLAEAGVLIRPRPPGQQSPSRSRHPNRGRDGFR